MIRSSAIALHMPEMLFLLFHDFFDKYGWTAVAAVVGFPAGIQVGKMVGRPRWRLLRAFVTS